MEGIDGSGKSTQIHLLEKWLIPVEDNDSTFFKLANFYLDNLRKRAEAIEDGVDWVFEDKLKVVL